MDGYFFTCKQCDKPQMTQDSRKQFCNRSCAATYNNTASPKRVKAPSKMAECLGCDLRIQIRGEQKYCTSTCRQAHTIKLWLNNEYDPTTKVGLSVSFRLWLIESVGSKCENCGWSGTNPVSKKSTLQIDHVDGKWYNNRRDNLKVLCPNCHSLTPSYGALNKGSGRSNRYPGAVA